MYKDISGVGNKTRRTKWVNLFLFLWREPVLNLHDFPRYVYMYIHIYIYILVLFKTMVFIDFQQSTAAENSATQAWCDCHKLMRSWWITGGWGSVGSTSRHLRCRLNEQNVGTTPRETNSSPLKMVVSKFGISFSRGPPFSGALTVSFREGTPSHHQDYEPFLGSGIPTCKPSFVTLTGWWVDRTNFEHWFCQKGSQKKGHMFRIDRSGMSNNVEP